MYYGSREPQWLVETPKEAQSHYDNRGCVRQIRTTSVYQSNSGVQTRPGRTENLASRGSYRVEQPAMVNADSQAYIHHAVSPAVPATHQAVDRRAFAVVNNIPVSNRTENVIMAFHFYFKIPFSKLPHWHRNSLIVSPYANRIAR